MASVISSHSKVLRVDTPRPNELESGRRSEIVETDARISAHGVELDANEVDTTIAGKTETGATDSPIPTPIFGLWLLL